ncbi:MAG: AAC(3) family N-acetyltransferase [Lachnospiraceae bacterium]|nr:AAC(3) family N-acetyltransferase [Lachnospiraceae bacterium]
MYTKEMLKKQLEEMGLQGTDTLFVHSSMKAIGEVAGGADTVIDAWMEYFKEGLLLLPTHTWKQMSESYNVFHPETEPACVGLLPNVFRRREGVVRSLHPTHSVAAYGKDALEYIGGEELLPTPCHPDGVMGRLLSRNAKILLVGVTHIRNTFIHAVEEMYEVPERFTEKPVDFEVVMPDGSYRKVPMYRHYNRHTAHISESYDKMLEGYFETGVTKKYKFGDAECILCDAKGIYEVTGRVLKKERNCFIDRETIPREWYL